MRGFFILYHSDNRFIHDTHNAPLEDADYRQSHFVSTHNVPLTGCSIAHSLLPAAYCPFSPPIFYYPLPTFQFFTSPGKPDTAYAPVQTRVIAGTQN